ncbi:MAG TPA: multiheme c-type cytochrome [Thermoanaerobaculia bacterium]|nr:multiheme c-type cytochrome [Thermoanaerobaculia bacterium]
MSSVAPDSPHGSPPSTPTQRRKYVPAVGPQLKKVLFVVLGLFALLAVNSTYLLGVSLLEWATGRVYQNWFYLNMFLVHLALGALIVLPILIFGISHIKNAHNRPNRRAVYAGYALFTVALILLASGIVLTRLEGVIVVKDPKVRSLAYWAHVITPVLAAWLFVLHRLAGRKIRWQVGLRWAAVAGVFAGLLVIWQAQDPRQWNVAGPASGEQYFFPSLARTATGNFIPEEVLDNSQYCLKCHADTHAGWAVSAHRFSSGNNPPYLKSVNETREVAYKRDGDVQASRFCAGCHDLVPFFSGKFDEPSFELGTHPSGQAGITCSGCHSITNVNTVRGNSDYTIEEAVQYPFTGSDSPFLAFLNEQLIKAKPEFHKRTYLKPLHKTPEFCGACHKVHLPEQLNKYKWLRGQNHYDSYHLSGVSGHGVQAFYFPDKAQDNCNGCHLKLAPSTQFAARDFDGTGILKIHDHQFPSANTGIPHLLGMPEWVNQKHLAFNEGVMRVDLFGLKAGGEIDGPLVAPLRPTLPTLEPGQSYLLEAVVRTAKMGHHFTQGTADSNEVWLDVVVKDGERVIGRSGGLGPNHEVDPWSHFANVYMLDREGRRIDRRNAQDIFIPLYNHQIPPGAADTLHYRLTVPREVRGPLTIEARLQYRKFDTRYLQFVFPEMKTNDLPIMTLAVDRVTLPVAGGAPLAAEQASPILEWQRWNDYGIGLLLKGGKSKGELRQAEEAFARVEALGRPEGAINQARVYLAQGTVQDQAVAALARAAAFDPPAPSWSVAWFRGLVNKQNGFLDEAIADFRSILALDDAETRKRGFDFSQDYRLLNELGQTLFERSKLEHGENREPRRKELLTEAASLFERTLAFEPEEMGAHYNLSLIYRQLDRPEDAKRHLELYRKYKPDDNARDRAVAIARAANPAADHAAEAIVIYDLSRAGAYELADAGPTRRAEAFEIELPATPPAAPVRVAQRDPANEPGERRPR